MAGKAGTEAFAEDAQTRTAQNCKRLCIKPLDTLAAGTFRRMQRAMAPSSLQGYQFEKVSQPWLTLPVQTLVRRSGSRIAADFSAPCAMDGLNVLLLSQSDDAAHKPLLLLSSKGGRVETSCSHLAEQEITRHGWPLPISQARAHPVSQAMNMGS